MRWFRILLKDVRILARNRALLAALLAYPFLLATILGAAFGEPPTRLDIAVVNHDAGGAKVAVGNETLDAGDLILAMSSFANVQTSATEDQALSRLRQGEVDAILVIPRNFVRDVVNLGQTATLRVIVDESDPVRAEVARNAVTGAIDDFVNTVIEKKIEDVIALLDLTVDGGTTRISFVNVQVLGITKSRERLVEVLDTLDPSSVEARKVRDVIVFLDFAAGVLGNADTYLRTTAIPLHVQESGLASQGTSLVTIALPGALVLGVFWTGALAASLLVARDVETGVRRRLVAAPTPRWMLASAKGLVALVAALAPAVVLLGIGYVVLGATVENPALAIVTLLLASLAAAALGALAAVVARGTSAAALLVVLTLLPMLILGGLFYPVAYMPPAARLVSSALPMTLATDAMRGALVRGSTWLEVAPALVGLAVFALLAGLATRWLADKAAAR